MDIEEVFETPRTPDGRLATLAKSNATALLALHRGATRSRQRAGVLGLAQRYVTLDVSVRRLPRGDEPRHFYVSLWSRDQELKPLTDERLVMAAPAGDDVERLDRRHAASFQGILVSELVSADVWLICRAYKIGRLKDEDGPTRFEGSFDGIGDDVGLFRRQIGVAGVDLSGAVARDDLKLTTTKEPLVWDAASAPLWRPAATDPQQRSRVWARMPRYVAAVAVVNDGGVPPPPPVGSGSSPVGDRVVEKSPMRAEFSVAARLDVPPGDKDVPRVRLPGGGLLADAPHMLTRRKSPRDDLYVTLESGSFSQDAKLAARSVEVRARLVHSGTGAVLSNVARGSRRPSKQYRSSTNYHVNKPSWEETFRVALPDDDLRKYHLHFAFTHCRTDRKSPRSAFAFAFLPLSSDDDAARAAYGDKRKQPAAKAKDVVDKGNKLLASLPIADGDHRLTCFKHDDYGESKATAERPAYLTGAAQERGWRLSATGAFLALGNSMFTTQDEAPDSDKVRFSERECFIARTHLVSERRAPAEAPELHALMRWRTIDAGAATVSVIKAAAKAILDATDGGSKVVWPSRLFFRAFLKALLSIFVAKRAPGEPAAAYAALASALATFAASKRGSLRAGLRRALSADFDRVLPDAPSSPKRPPSKQLSATDDEDAPPVTATPEDADVTAEETWLPSSVLLLPEVQQVAPAPVPHEATDPRHAEESWARFLAQSAAGAFDVPHDDGEEPPPPPPPLAASTPLSQASNRSRVGSSGSVDSPASAELPGRPSLHSALLHSIAAPLQWLDALGDDDDELRAQELLGAQDLRRSAVTDTVAALDSLMAIVCASFARSGGAAVEDRQSRGAGGTPISTLALVDDVLGLCRRLLTRRRIVGAQQQLAWFEKARRLCISSLAGTFEALQACFPLAIVADRAAIIAAALPSAQQPNESDTGLAALELGFLRGLARAPVFRSSTDNDARLALGRTLSSHAMRLMRAPGAAYFVRGLAAQIVGELVSAALAARDAMTATTLASALVPDLFAVAAATSRERGPPSREGPPTPPPPPQQQGSLHIPNTPSSQELSTPQATRKPTVSRRWRKSVNDATPSTPSRSASQKPGAPTTSSTPSRSSSQKPAAPPATSPPPRSSPAPPPSTATPRRSSSMKPLLSSTSMERRSSSQKPSIAGVVRVAGYDESRYWQSSFAADARAAEDEAGRRGAADDAVQDLAATCLSLLRVVSDASLVEGDRLRAALRGSCGLVAHGTAPFDADAWPLLAACAWSTFWRVLALAAAATVDSNDDKELADVFDLGLALLEAPETDAARMSDARLAYLVKAGSDVDLRPATVELLDGVWRRLAPAARDALSGVALPRATRLLGRGGAVTTLATRLVADLVVAELKVHGDLARFEGRLVAVLDDYARDAGLLTDSEVRARDRLGVALASTVPCLVADVIQLGQREWRPALARAAELHVELLALARPKATEIEIACAYSRLVAADGPFLRRDTHGTRYPSWMARAARRATDLAAKMAKTGASHVEAGIALLRAADARAPPTPPPHRNERRLSEDLREAAAAEVDDARDYSDESLRLIFDVGVNEVDAVVEASRGAAAGRRARARRAASLLFDAADPPAYELSLACSEATIDELRASGRADRRLRDAVAAEMRHAATYYAKLDALPRRACVVFRCRFDASRRLPDRLRGREFVYRAAPGARLVDFVDIVRDTVGEPVVLVPSNVDLDDTSGIEEGAAPRIQASMLEPEEEDDTDNADWPPPLQRAFRLAPDDAPWRPARIWAHEWPVKKNTTDTTLDVWVERRFVVLDEPIAAATRWVPVARAFSASLNPLEVALRTLKRKNIELRHVLFELHHADVGLQRHTMAINGVVDAAVNGGLSNWTPLVTGDYETSHPEIHDDLIDTKANLPLTFRNELQDHLRLVADCVDLHRVKCHISMRPLAAHIDTVSCVPPVSFLHVSLGGPSCTKSTRTFSPTSALPTIRLEPSRATTTPRTTTRASLSRRHACPPRL